LIQSPGESISLEKNNLSPKKARELAEIMANRIKIENNNLFVILLLKNSVHLNVFDKILSFIVVKLNNYLTRKL